MDHILENLTDKLSEHPDVSVIKDEPMSRHTTFKIGGPARMFVQPRSQAAAVFVLETLYKAGVAPLVIGNGSNLLVSDSGIDRVVVKLGSSSCECVGDTVRADAGAPLVSLAKCALSNSLSGIEFLYGIPGSVGGAVVMNAGAYGGEISDVLVETTYFSRDGKVLKLDAASHEFAYRNSVFKKEPERIILSSTFKLKGGDASEIKKNMDELMSRRREKQPLEYPSAGSVFKRPPGHFAGALIEKCGLKGYRIGGAEVSEKHAGFIINKGNATCDDVLGLIDYIKETVLKNTGVELECEICHI